MPGKMIPDEIKQCHVLKAIESIRTDKVSVPNRNRSTGYDLVYKGKTYPPKFVIGLARHYAMKRNISTKGFRGGSEANNFLGERGFYIHPK